MINKSTTTKCPRFPVILNSEFWLLPVNCHPRNYIIQFSGLLLHPIRGLALVPFKELESMVGSFILTRTNNNNFTPLIFHHFHYHSSLAVSTWIKWIMIHFYCKRRCCCCYPTEECKKSFFDTTYSVWRLICFSIRFDFPITQCHNNSSEFAQIRLDSIERQFRHPAAGKRMLFCSTNQSIMHIQTQKNATYGTLTRKDRKVNKSDRAHWTHGTGILNWMTTKHQTYLLMIYGPTKGRPGRRWFEMGVYAPN